MKKATICLTVFIGAILNVFCQVNVDSLMTIWNDTIQPDTTRLEAINNIAWDGYLYGQPDSAKFYAQLQYDFAKSKGLKKHMAKALNTQGAAFWIQSNYASAIDHYAHSLSINEEIGDKNSIANSLNNIGVVYLNQSNYASAIEYFTRSLAISEEIGDKIRIANSLNNIGLVYKNLGDYVNAIDYYSRSLTIQEEIMDKQGMAASLSNIGIIHDIQGNHTNAIDFHIRSLIIREEIGDKKGIGISLNNIGLNFREQGDSAFSSGNEVLSANMYDSALDYHTRSLAIKREIGFKNGIAGSLNNIGDIYYNKGNYDRAIKYNTRALNIAQEIGAEMHIKDIAHSLYKIYKDIGKSQPALEMYELYTVTKDSIESDETQREVIRQEYKYEYEKQALADSLAFAKEQAVSDANLEKSRIQQYALYGGLILLMAFLAFIYNRYRLTHDQKLIIADQNEEITTALETLKVAQAQLVQSEKMASLGQLTAGIAHEINNPLNFISSSSHALVNDLEDLKKLNFKYREALFDSTISKEEILEFEKSVDIEYLQKALKEEIDGIKEGTRRTSEIVKGLREFSQGDLVQMEPVDIHHGIDVTLNLLQSRISENVRITRNYDQSVEKIDCHIGQLNQVFMNLLVNALDAVGEEGEIEITTKNLENSIMISVKDDGPGIPEEILGKVFDPFFTTKEVGMGTGLGLSISHGIIENHGGRIEVNSQEGEGAEFLIYLPNNR